MWKMDPLFIYYFIHSLISFSTFSKIHTQNEHSYKIIVNGSGDKSLWAEQWWSSREKKETNTSPKYIPCHIPPPPIYIKKEINSLWIYPMFILKTTMINKQAAFFSILKDKIMLNALSQKATDCFARTMISNKFHRQILDRSLPESKLATRFAI